MGTSPHRRSSARPARREEHPQPGAEAHDAGLAGREEPSADLPERGDDRPTYHPGDKLVPEKPSEELREVARGRSARTPFVVLGGLQLVVLGAIVAVLGIVALVVWLT